MLRTFRANHGGQGETPLFLRGAALKELRRPIRTDLIGVGRVLLQNAAWPVESTGDKDS